VTACDGNDGTNDFLEGNREVQTNSRCKNLFTKIPGRFLKYAPVLTNPEVDVSEVSEIQNYLKP